MRRFMNGGSCWPDLRFNFVKKGTPAVRPSCRAYAEQAAGNPWEEKHDIL
jgi:hypothetical protein